MKGLEEHTVNHHVEGSPSQGEFNLTLAYSQICLGVRYTYNPLLYTSHLPWAS